MPFVGVLFVGLMMAEERGGQPVVIEFNVRFGDPEVEALFMLLHDAGVDIANMLRQASKGNLDNIVTSKTFAKTAIAVAMAAAGYPVSARKGDEVHGLEPRPGVEIFHAGTKLDGDRVLVNGGRVLYMTTVGKTPDEAAERVYATIGPPDGVYFDGEQHRSDIGYQLRTM
jgi:phosphoribosylamine-glycine ligase